ncbi:MAG: hypothetical protein ABW217_21270 [Polyangiaceae bacterium]
MDLIATLSSQLGIDAGSDKGLAGSALGMLEQQVSQKLGDGDASALRAQLPELSEWKGAVEGASTGGGGLLGAAGGLLGGVLGGGGAGFDVGSLIQMATKFNVGPGAVQALVPIVLQFLQSRLEPGLLQRILSAVPALTGAKGKPGGGLAGALGGLLG